MALNLLTISAGAILLADLLFTNDSASRDYFVISSAMPSVDLQNRHRSAQAPDQSNTLSQRVPSVCLNISVPRDFWLELSDSEISTANFMLGNQFTAALSSNTAHSPGSRRMNVYIPPYDGNSACSKIRSTIFVSAIYSLAGDGSVTLNISARKNARQFRITSKSAIKPGWKLRAQSALKRNPLINEVNESLFFASLAAIHRMESLSFFEDQ